MVWHVWLGVGIGVLAAGMLVILVEWRVRGNRGSTIEELKPVVAATVREAVGEAMAQFAREQRGAGQAFDELSGQVQVHEEWLTEMSAVLKVPRPRRGAPEADAQAAG